MTEVLLLLFPVNKTFVLSLFVFIKQIFESLLKYLLSRSLILQGPKGGNGDKGERVNIVCNFQ